MRYFNVETVLIDLDIFKNTFEKRSGSNKKAWNEITHVVIYLLFMINNLDIGAGCNGKTHTWNDRHRQIG